MNLIEKSRKVLEFDKILDMLLSYTDNEDVKYIKEKMLIMKM